MRLERHHGPIDRLIHGRIGRVRGKPGLETIKICLPIGFWHGDVEIDHRVSTGGELDVLIPDRRRDVRQTVHQRH